MAKKPAKANKADRQTPEAAPPSVLPTAVVRRLHLTPGELALKTDCTLTRAAPGPFDRDACLHRLARVTKCPSYLGWDWDGAEIPESMTDEEADFWLHALLHEKYENTPRAMVAAMQEHTCKQTPSVDAVRHAVQSGNTCRHLLLRPIAQLLSGAQIFDWFVAWFAGEEGTKPDYGHWITGLLDGSAVTFGRTSRRSSSRRCA